MYYRSALPRIKQMDFLGIWLFRPFQKFYCRARVKYISNQIIPNRLPLFMTKVFVRTLISSSKTTLVNTARTAGLARLLSCNVKSGAKFDSGAGDWHVYARVTRQLAREAQTSSGTQGLAQLLVLGVESSWSYWASVGHWLFGWNWNVLPACVSVMLVDDLVSAQQVSNAAMLVEADKVQPNSIFKFQDWKNSLSFHSQIRPIVTLHNSLFLTERDAFDTLFDHAPDKLLVVKKVGRVCLISSIVTACQWLLLC